ncbi:MAG: TRAP-type mannitol/chloroaromatic compound transport system permease small subunit [Flavobacteriales bacterium]|jgi:TRAP-type mannitol/chloroaromatic compound transport system permease small subunit
MNTFISTLQAIAASNGKAQSLLGRSLSWFILIMTIIVSAIVALRYFFGLSSTASQESVSYLHASVFMLGMAYASHCGAHVRVDIFYRNFQTHNQAWVNLIGNLVFLLPFAGFLSFISWHWALGALEHREGSINPGGLPFVYVLKLLVPACGILLSIQALADSCKHLADITQKISNSSTLPSTPTTEER